VHARLGTPRFACSRCVLETSHVRPFVQMGCLTTAKHLLLPDALQGGLWLGCINYGEHCTTTTLTACFEHFLYECSSLSAGPDPTESS
jgi:hypothetical protein